ncbi:hypothetical protein CR513_08685, partial [Mucuna pruriens]
MAAELALRWPLSWMADVDNAIGPLFIGLLGLQGTKNSKVVGGDRLDHQRTPLGLILNILAILGEPSSLAMAIVVDGGTTEAKPFYLMRVETTKKRAYQYEKLCSFLMENGFERGKVDITLFSQKL